MSARKSVHDPRPGLRRAIFAACRARGLDDEARHDLQMRVTGVASLTDMDEAQMQKLLNALNGSKGRRGDALPPGSLSRVLIALWLSAWHLGVVRDRRTSALCAFVRRQTGCDAARFSNPSQIARAIEALKAWMARDGGVDWSPYPQLSGPSRDVPAARILEALWHRRKPDLCGLGIWVASRGHPGRNYTHLDNDALNQLIAELGRELRGGK